MTYVTLSDAEAIKSLSDIAELIDEGAGSPGLTAQLKEDIAMDTEPINYTDEDGEDEREVMEFEDDLHPVCFTNAEL